MASSERVRPELETVTEQLTRARRDLESAVRAEAEAKATYDRAIQQCFDGELPVSAEEQARHDCTTATLGVDRLRRIVALLERRVQGKAADLNQLERSEAAGQCDATLRAVHVGIDEILEIEEQIARIRKKVHTIIDKASPHFRRINRPEIDYRWEVMMRSDARRAGHAHSVDHK